MTDEGAGVTDAEVEQVPERQATTSYEEFGVQWIHRILHKDRILAVVDEILGDEIRLGPIGAGPGRALASVSVVGKYRPTTGEQLPGDLLRYRIDLPISVVFDLALPVDRLTFNAEVLAPLVLTIHTELPVRLRMQIDVPAEEDLVITLGSDTRRGSVFQKITNLEGELRRFMLKVVRIELDKPYVQRALNLDMEQLIDNAWPQLSAQFLPQGPEDRQG